MLHAEGREFTIMILDLICSGMYTCIIASLLNIGMVEALHRRRGGCLILYMAVQIFNTTFSCFLALPPIMCMIKNELLKDWLKIHACTGT